jgi:hypothetical protein
MFPQCVKSAADKQYKQDSINISTTKNPEGRLEFRVHRFSKSVFKILSHKKMEIWAAYIFSSRSLLKSKIYIKTRENATY